MPSTWTNGALELLMTAGMDLSTATLKVMLLNSAYVPDADHQYADDLTAFEVTGTGYTGGFSGSGRKTLASASVTKDDALNEVRLDATNPTWSGLDVGTIGCAAIIHEITDDPSSPVIALLHLVPGVVSNGGTFTLELGTFAIKLVA